MTIQLRGSSFPAGTGNLTVPVNIPTGVQAGDLALAFWISATPAATTAAPSGWTLVGYSQGSSTNLQLVMFSRTIVSSSEAGVEVDFTLNASTAQGAAMVVYYDDAGGTVAIDNQAFRVGVGLSMPACTTVHANAIAIGVSCSRNGTNENTSTWTAPSGYTKIGQNYLSSGSGKSWTIAHKLTPVAAGTNIGGSSFTESNTPSNDTTLSVALYAIAPPSVRTNYITNPNAETNTTGWTPTAGETITRDTTQQHSGSASFKVTKVSTSTTQVYPTAVAAAAGDVWTASAWLRIPAGTFASFYAVGVYFYSSAFALLSYTAGTAVPANTGNGGVWTRYSATGTAPASTAYVLLVVNNLQSMNSGYAFWIDDAMLEKTATLGSYFDGSTAADGTYTYAWSGTANASTSIATPGTLPHSSATGTFSFTVGEPPTVAKLKALTHGYAAHRGGMDEIPSETITGYNRTALLGKYLVLETDCQMNASGSIVLWHDVTITDGTTRVDSQTDTQWNALTVPWPTGYSGDPSPAPASYWHELADAWGGKRILMPEMKDAGAVDTALLDDIEARGLKESCIVQCFDNGLTRLPAAVARGFHTMSLYGTTPATSQWATVAAAGVEFIGLTAGAFTSTDVAAAHAAGLIVWSYVITTPTGRDNNFATGVDGIFTNDPSTVPLAGGIEGFASGHTPTARTVRVGGVATTPVKKVRVAGATTAASRRIRVAGQPI